MTNRQQVIPESFGRVIHFIIQKLQSGHAMFGFPISDMAIHMSCIALDRDGLNDAVEATNEVKTLLCWLRNEFVIENSQCALVVTGDLDASLMNGVNIAQSLKNDGDANEACKLASVRISFLDGTGNNVNTCDPVNA